MEAEQALRQGLKIRLAILPETDVLRPSAVSVLGDAVARQGKSDPSKFVEAEKLLIGAYGEMDAIPSPPANIDSFYKRRAVERIVALYADGAKRA